MTQSQRLGPVLILVAAGACALVWGHGRGDRDTAIPLIDRNDPAHAEALFHLDRRAVGILLGKPNHPIEKVTGEQLRLVRELSHARLSQTVYESRIAQGEKLPDQNVVITIPAYRRAGTKLERLVLDDVLHGMADPVLRQRVETFFFHFGRTQQSLTVSAGVESVDDQPVTIYSIVHRLGGRDAIPMTVGSRLPASHLVTYAPFQTFFPAPRGRGGPD